MTTPANTKTVTVHPASDSALGYEYHVTPRLLEEAGWNAAEDWLAPDPDMERTLVLSPRRVDADDVMPHYCLRGPKKEGLCQGMITDTREAFSAIPAPGGDHWIHDIRTDTLAGVIRSAALSLIDLEDVLPWAPSDIERRYYRIHTQL